ncbi:MAG: tetratricopeptide repeat protein [Aquabacterium sp.]
MKPVQRIVWILAFTLPALALARAPDARAQEQQLQAAQVKLAAGQHDQAWRLYRPLAAHGHPLAQFVVGQFFQQGWGRPADPVAACTWFEKAAHKHVPYAEHLWADCLAQGVGRLADIPQALAWYERAAEDGHWLSLCTAAGHLIRGEGVAKDVARGLALCTRAAQADSPPAMLALARHLDEGGDVPQDLVTARHWYEQAAQRRVPAAQYRLGVMLAEGLGGPADPDAALFWLESAASAGFAAAYLPTAVLYGNAPVQADSRALAPAYLAKAYLWAAAAKARPTDEREQARARLIEGQILAVMPASWRPDLDRKVAEHLTRFNPP